MKKYIIPLIITFIIQIFISNLLSIRGVKPDFLIIFLVYFALDQGSFRGVVVGFVVGFIVSFFDNSYVFGVLPLTYSIVGYGTGFLRTEKKRMIPYKFNAICFSIILFSFFVYNYFLFDTYFYNDLPVFLLNWLKTTLYTVTLLLILQFIYPMRR